MKWHKKNEAYVKKFHIHSSYSCECETFLAYAQIAVNEELSSYMLQFLMSFLFSIYIKGATSFPISGGFCYLLTIFTKS